MAFKWMTPVKPGKQGYVPMREAIRQACIDKNISPTVLARELQLDRGYLFDYLVGDKDSIEAETAAKIMRRLGLSMDAKPAKPEKTSKAGSVRLGGYEGRGIWREKQSYGETTGVEPDPNFPAEDQLIFQVLGLSDMERAENGDFLLTLVKGFPILEGSNVLIRKTRGEMEQITAYKVRVLDDKTELWAKSIDSEPARLNANRLPRNHEIIGAVLKIIKRT